MYLQHTGTRHTYNMDLSGSHVFLLVVFAVLTTPLVESRYEEVKPYYLDFFTKKCECRVETWEGQILHEFGIIETYPFPEVSCHDVHQKCRHACAAKLDLEGTIDGSQLGSHYCDAYGTTTPPDGVTLVAVWKPKYCPHHAEEDSSKEVQLCCGKRFVSVMGTLNNIKLFGWKDC